MRSPRAQDIAEASTTPSFTAENDELISEFVEQNGRNGRR
jgi:hypothetical protein